MNGVRTPDAEMLGKLASYFGVSIDYLLERTDKPRMDTDLWDRDTPPTDMELEELLRSSNPNFFGAPLNDEDIEDILTYMRVNWERNRKNVRRGSRTRNVNKPGRTKPWPITKHLRTSELHYSSSYIL